VARQLHLPSAVVILGGLVIMNVAIEFDRQAYRWTIEIEHRRSNAVPAGRLPAGEPLLA